MGGGETGIEAEPVHDPAGGRIVGLEDTEDGEESELVESPVERGGRRLGGVAAAPVPEAQTPSHLDGRKHFGQEVRYRQTGPAHERALGLPDQRMEGRTS